MRELYDSDLQGFVDILDDNVLELTTIHTILVFFSFYCPGIPLWNYLGVYVTILTMVRT